MSEKPIAKVRVVNTATGKVEKVVTGPLVERRWPDDFRGFGTNVQPKKQK